MEWLLSSPQIHSTFGLLGFNKSDGYHIDENCNAALKNILYNIVTEDKILHSYRKSINFGQYVKKDIIPVLIHAQDNETIQLSIEILVNLTIPVECLLSVETLSKTDCGRQTIFEIKNLLSSTKHAFSDQRTTKVVMDFFKKNLETQGEFTHEQRGNINNCLLLLRNILNIPEELKGSNQNERTLQNQIVWNVFSQSLDKILLKLMTMPEVNLWSVIIVQLVALFYKDQHVVTLHEHLNLWLEATLSESSEDNESNTSPSGRGSEDSLPILTSDPTSDSSDAGGSRKSNDEQNLMKSQWDESNTMDIDSNMLKKLTNSTDKSNTTLLKEETELHYFETKDDIDKMQSSDSNCSDIKTKMLTSENSDCGYGTQMETQESISTSSNEDDLPAKKSFYQKPHNSKQRVNPKPRMGTTLQERKRKKIVRRGKCNNINIHGLLHKTPTEDDISNVLKEFTVDFLIKGYNSLVQTLHEQIITNLQLEIDTSHFFWLVTYFLKFVVQIELDLEHLDSVLSYDIISYLTAEGVILCEQLELALKLDGSNLKPCVRKLHLLFTAIKEFVQTIETYTKLPHLSKENKETLQKLKLKICETEELHSLMVLLLMHYNSLYLSKQYLQDLIVTNHIILSFVDNSMRELISHKRTNNMSDHIRQFATPKIMYQYGLLLEDYAVNGEFVNDCIFTMMHHVGGELDSLITLFQPKILKTFTSIWKSEFEICDDWSDLVEYVINTFVKKPRTMQSLADVRIETHNIGENVVNKQPPPSYPEVQPDQNESQWNAEEISSLNWIYMQCSSADVIGEILKSLEDDGILKSRQSIIKELHKENTITNEQYEEFMKNEIGLRTTFSAKDVRNEEINKLCEQLRNDEKTNFLHWVQTVLLDTCFVRIYLDRNPHLIENIKTKYTQGRKLFNRNMFKKKSYEIPVMSSIAYHSLVAKKSVPLVPWNCEQAAICKDLKFLQLLHKLGFHMPVDSGRVFIRIPHIWSAEFLYEIAGKIGPIDTQKLKFCIDDIRSYKTENLLIQSSDMIQDISKETTSLKNSENAYKIQRSKHVTAMVNFMPMPSTSFTANIEEKFKKENWLELVKKSQDCKLSLYMTRMDEIQKADVACSEIIPDDVEGFNGTNAQSFSSRLPGPSPVVTSIINGHTLVGSMSLSESENNSLCDTATTASDLTRMYVSDEDEKLVGEASQRAAPFCPKSKAPNVRLRKRRHIRSKPAVPRRHYTKD